ncbi:glycosyl hydrolase family 18 protein [Sphingobacterium deserti]|uniref:mannosyl-glycoprotein endo-beta-N-acetylglucosaminidase n=1 Tax=Sphingobacterium deserti TaxID=1229276 RepID=A0A0B8T751_9SPHI|nr:glycosyl hydrolase family 18 protein [Sphingobacterium deserti]KGE13450.1 hypothetical protein DI53_2779 [Sphingobacterium deserti]
MTKKRMWTLIMIGVLGAASILSCKKETVYTEPAQPVANNFSLNYPLFAEYWGLLPEYQIANFGLVKAEDVPDGTNIVHLFVFDKHKDASTGAWVITNRFASSYEAKEQSEEIPADIVEGIRNIQSRGIAVIFSIFTPDVQNEQDADAFASACYEFTEKWQLDGVEIDLEGVPTTPFLIPALGKYFGPESGNNKILAVVDFSNHNLSFIRDGAQYLNYMNTMTYWNTSSTVASVLAPYAEAMGDAKKVLIGVGGGPAINPGQATPRGEEVKIAQWLKSNSPGTGMMNFIMDADYSTLDNAGNVSRSMQYSEGIINALK